MTREAIQQAIRTNLERAGLLDADIRVQPDSFSGWQVAVIADGFAEKNPQERRRIALEGLDTAEIEWDEFLTPEEREWSAELLGDADPEDAPLWPEALARGQNEVPEIRFPSDLDEDLQLPVRVSFYSLRGGVGRSTALGYTGRILSSHGWKVICVDMDLEAPGLASLFGCEEKVSRQQGVAELLVRIDQGETPDVASHLVKASEDDLYCLPAGVPDAGYARLLRFIDPVAWYREERNPLRELVRMLEVDLPFRPDVLLFDTRTGITPLSGPLLFDLADIAVVTYFPHPQAQSGTGALVRALLGSRTQRRINGHRLTPEPRFLVSPIPASQAREVVDRYRNRSIEWMEEWLQAAPSSGLTSDLEEITHFISYQEILATSDAILENQKVWLEYEPIVRWIERFLPVPSENRVLSALAGEKSQILNGLHFSTGTAERQDNFSESFIETDTILKAMEPAIPLVIGRKGTGKTAVFRRMMAFETSVVVHAPSPLDRGKPWVLSPEGFTAVANLVEENKCNWRWFWAFYVCLALRSRKWAADLSKGESLPGLSSPVTDERDAIRKFTSVLDIDQLGLHLNEWLGRMDVGLPEKAVLLFDGLDVGFGSGPDDKRRRNSAISGLFDFWMNLESRLRRISFKIFLREDLWKSIRFENKSHLYGRSVTLKWNEPLMYFKVAIRQADQSEAFHKALEGVTRKDHHHLPRRFENWSKDDLQAAWNLLVGERMKGGKTAFTRNWVWSRLADGKNDHSPRYLLQLFHRIVAWEKDEHLKSPYERSIVRPRAMEKCLPDVSHSAMDALLEEFGELGTLIDHIQNRIDRTPIPAGAFEGFDGHVVKMAVEAGLLSVYEGTTENVERYKVPDLFRHALNLTRKGQL